MVWFRGVASVSCALTLALALPASAEADSWYGSDPMGDVQQTVHDPEPAPCGTNTVTPLPDDTTHDITRLRLRHGPATVVVTLQLRDLIAEGRHFTTVTLRADTGVYWLDVLRFANGRVDYDVVRRPRQLPPPDECGNILVTVLGRPCAGLTARWDADADLIQLAVPRACVRRPEWVSASASVYTIRGRTTVLDDRWQPTAGAGYFTPRVLGG
jgi:hypothetical protein